MPYKDGFCVRCVLNGDSKKEVVAKEARTKTKRIRTRSKKRQKEAMNGGQNKLFLEIWNESFPKKSRISGRDLSWLEVGSSLWRSCFAHILPKGKYPEYRLYKINVLLVHNEEHLLLDQGTEEQRQEYKEKWEAEGYLVDWGMFYELQEKLKTFYPWK